jgi:hypothetical protein
MIIKRRVILSQSDEKGSVTSPLSYYLSELKPISIMNDKRSKVLCQGHVSACSVLGAKNSSNRRNNKLFAINIFIKKYARLAFLCVMDKSVNEAKFAHTGAKLHLTHYD